MGKEPEEATGRKERRKTTTRTSQKGSIWQVAGNPLRARWGLIQVCVCGGVGGRGQGDEHELVRLTSEGGHVRTMTIDSGASNTAISEFTVPLTILQLIHPEVERGPAIRRPIVRSEGRHGMLKVRSCTGR